MRDPRVAIAQWRLTHSAPCRPSTRPARQTHPLLATVGGRPIYFSASPIVHLSREESSTSMKLLYCVCYSHARPDSQWDGFISFSERDADFSAHLISVVVQLRNPTLFSRVIDL